MKNDEKDGFLDSEEEKVEQEDSNEQSLAVIGEDDYSIIMDAPSGATCTEVIKHGERAGEVCGKPAKSLINNRPVCPIHLSFYTRDKDWVVQAQKTKKGRIVRFGLIRKCKDCFMFRGGQCPYGPKRDEEGKILEPDKVCVFETGKFAKQDVSINNKEDLTNMLEGLLNDDLDRLKWAKLMEHFEGGIPDGAVDNMTKRVRGDAIELARLKGVLSGPSQSSGPSQPLIQQNFLTSLFDKMPTAEVIDAEIKEEENK